MKPIIKRRKALQIPRVIQHPTPVNIARQKKERAIKKIAITIWYWAPAILWMVVIFSFSSMQGDDMPKFDIPNIDKFFHFVEYFILGALLVRAFANSSENINHRNVLIASIAIAVIYGFSDELHQLFVSGRSCDILDLLSDAVGSAFGAGLSIYKERISRAAN